MPAVPEPVLLIADIGGTNARFALADSRRRSFASEITLQCADFETPEDAIRAYLRDLGVGRPAVVCCAVAGPVDAGAVDFTNSHWRLDGPRLAAAFRTDRVALINDFESIALGLPLLESRDLLNVHSIPAPGFSGNVCVGVMGAGTGLGAAGLVYRDGASFPLVTEAGHVGFSPATALQAEVCGYLARQYERVSNERLVSGQGIENVYRALSVIEGAPDGGADSAAGIFRAAADASDQRACRAVELFFEVLGQAAGDFVLSIGAYDGLYLAGGLLRRYSRLVRRSGFRSAFENKGRLARQLRRTPSLVIVHDQPGLLGVSELARRMHRA